MSLLSRLQTQPPHLIGSSRSAIRDDDSFISRFDRISVLGTSEEDQAVSQTAHYGHTGCVNALGWNEDGSLLVSGSDDFRLCLWKLGHADGSVFPPTGLRRSHPRVELGLNAVIHTGHRRNIFSAKFAPHTNSKRLLSCAGDSQVRVFELERATSSTFIRGTRGRNWHEYSEADGACIRVIRCHRDRAKRIALEGSPDVFLTCAEDGTVRQHDLRQAHSCTPATRGSTCPPPLADYGQFHNMGLYTLSVSIARPDVFVVAGTSPYAFLHDRRMTRRSMMEQWGQVLQPELPTQCVRRFGLPSHVTHDANGGQRRPFHDHHVTATKLSNANGRDLLVSYSGDAVYRYDILADPYDANNIVPPAEAEEAGPVRIKRKRPSRPPSPTEPVAKRVISPISSAPPVVEAGPSHSQAMPLPSGLSGEAAIRWRQRRIINCLSLSISESDRELRPQEALEQLASLDDRSDEDARHSCQRYARALMLTEAPIDLDSVKTAAQEAVDAAGWLDAPPRRSGQLEYEVRIGDDGELQVSYGATSLDDEEADESEDVDMDYAQESEGSGESEDEEEELMEESDDDEDDEPDEAVLQRIRKAREREAGVHADVPTVLPLASYSGHRNVDTVKDVNFGGLKDQHVVSGSDDGRFFCWNKDSGELEGIWNADGSVCNVLKFHPLLPICAASGIDDSIKIFSPTSSKEKRFGCMEEATDIMAQNASRTNRGRGLMAPSAQVLMELLAQRVQNDPEEVDEDGRRIVRVNPGEDCVVM